MFKSYKKEFQKELAHLYSVNEISIIFRTIIDKHNATEFKNSNDREKIDFQLILNQLKKNIPYQYVLGETCFFGEKFFVNKNTLIPRPETEELIEWCLQDYTNEQSVIDIGTGSGIIPIILKKKIKKIEVSAVEKEQLALKKAKENAIFHRTLIHFTEDNFLNYDLRKYKTYDIIISNPPYIEDNKIINAQVSQHEPHSALFVPNDNPLLFYKKIIEFSQQFLSKNGKIYVEINQNLAKETQNLFKESFTKVELRKDISGNYRMIKVCK